MRRFSSAVSIFVVFLVALVTAHHVSAQEDAPTSGHPLVGAWVLDLAENGGRLLTFSGDGTVIFADINGTTAQGTWEATGDTTAVFTTYQLGAEQLGEGPSFTGYSILSGEVALDASGDSWTGDMVLATTDRDPVVQDLVGPLTLTATRILVIPAAELTIGTPLTGLPSAATPVP
jgi:hypothetical protein